MWDKIRKNRILKFVVPLAFWLTVWQLAALGVGKELLLPTPLSVCRELVSLGATADFWLSAGTTLLRIFAGVAIGTLIGVVLAILTRFTLGDWILSPLVKIIRATPVASFIIIVFLWLTRSIIPGFISALMVIPVIWGNVTKGISQTDRLLLEAADAYRFSFIKKIRLVYVPSVRPHFSSALNTSLGLAWKAGVAAEVLTVPRHSVGTELYDAKLYLETPSLFAWTVVVVALSFLLEYIVKLLFRIGQRRHQNEG